MNPYNCSIITSYDQLSDTEIKEFWNKSVCMDDWDIILIFPSDILYIFETDGEETISDDYGNILKKKVKKYCPKDQSLDNLLRSFNENKWYKIELNGREVAVGVGYHS